jgi:serine/threonine protein kinase
MGFALSDKRRPRIKVAPPVLIKNRYEIKDVLGRGGMGVVYQAFDTLMRREVAVKTLRDTASSAFVDLFYRECSVLTAMVHPNIVEIFDMGEFEEDGVPKPYFVMPLLPGRTLYDLIYPSGKPLPVERCTDIISQACRGLHAAHECGLLHRDIKPRNIFVMRDDAVKLIDFGVVRLLGSQTIGAPGTLGTLHYMAPEQIAMKPLTARSDIFSLATVCYEALTGVHPFVRENETETAAAVAEHMPPLASALNPQVNRPLAQAVAQAMAKDPRNRFESASAFADALQRGLRNERSGVTLLSNPQNRLARAQRSFARGDYEFTQEIVEQLEAEGLDSPEVRQLRSQLDQAVRKQQAEVHLATARRYFAEEEYVLASRRVSEVLAADPSHAAALSLRTEIERKLNELHIADSLARAAGHLDTGAFTEARRLIGDSLELQPGNAQAQRLLQEANQRALDWPRQRQQQEELFQAAQTAYFEGRFDSSLSALEQLAELGRQSQAAGARVTEYQDFYKRVRGDYEALQSMLADARKLLANGDTDGADLLSERLREQCSQDPDVRMLSKDIAARRDEREKEYRRGIALSISSEPDLSARLHILNQAARSRPNDEFFLEERQKLQAQLQQVTELVQRAQVYESSGRFDYAIEEWLCVGDVYPAYPGLKEQLARIKEVWKTARETAKADLRTAVQAALKQGDQSRAGALLQAAHADFQGDEDYLQLKTLVQTTADVHQEVAAALDRIQKAETEQRFADIPAFCQIAATLSQHIDPLREKSFNALTAAASRLVAANSGIARQILQEAAKIGAVPGDLQQAVRRQEREDEVAGILGEERSSAANLSAYRERVCALLEKYPGESRLEDRVRLLDAALVDERKQDEKRMCAAELALLSDELGDANDHRQLWDTYIRAKNIAAPFGDDPGVKQHLEAIREQGSQFEQAADALSRDRIKDCFAICDAMLARRPAHCLFQKLRDQAEVRHRQLGEEYLARVERWLASEPDLYQREIILQKAQEEYPFETRYPEELRHLDREKALIESLAAKARDFEKRGQTAEALVQWRQLRNIHGAYPGLAESIAGCESILDRQQRKVRAQRLLSQGEEHLTEGQFEQGYHMVYEASELSQDIPDLLRFAAPNLVASARTVLPTNPKLAAAMADLAQSLDDALRVPKELRAKISEACKAQDTTDCLKAIQARQEAADLPGALAVADQFLGQFPGVKQVESQRTRLLAELEQERKQQARAQALHQFSEMELSVANMGPTQLLRLKQDVREMARPYPGDEEVKQRASTLDSLLSSLAEVRALLQVHTSIAQVEEACARAFVKFPAHPLFQAAVDEAAQQKAAAAAKYLDDVKRRAAAEEDFSKQTAILREAIARLPAERSLLDQLAAVSARQNALNAQIEKARGLETKHLFGEAIKEWEGLRKDYPWYPGVPAEIERISDARRKEKQEGLERWFGQVDTAIENGDYDTASTMIRQAAQQQPDRKLQALDEKLKAGLKKKQDSDAKFAEGSRLLADGNLGQGGQALYRAFELQPKDQAKANSIALLLLGQIRANMASDSAACDGLLSHLNRIRPGQILPPDIREAIAKRRPAPATTPAGNRKMLEQVASLANQAEQARSDRSRSAVSKALQESKLLDAADPEVRRKAAELRRRIDSDLSGTALPLESTILGIKPTAERVSTGTIAAVAILLLSMAAVVFFVSRPRESGVPVQISVTPDHTIVELDGRTCISPDCNLSLQPGDHVVNLRKFGYKPKAVTINVKPGESTPLNLTATLDPVFPSAFSDTPPPSSAPEIIPVHDSEVARTALAIIQIRGARPGTRVTLDGSNVGVVSQDGGFRVDVPPGPHTLDLSLDGFSKRTIKRDFTRGEIVSLANDAVQLQRREPNLRR